MSWQQNKGFFFIYLHTFIRTISYQMTSKVSVASDEGTASSRSARSSLGPILSFLCRIWQWRIRVRELTLSLRGHFNRDCLEIRPSLATMSSSTQSSKTSSGTQDISKGRATNSVRPLPCLYHDPILRLSACDGNSGPVLDPMDRFLSEGPSEQYALFRRSDTGELSTSKGCSCGKRTGGVVAAQSSQTRLRRG